MKFYPYFPYSLSDFGEIRYNLHAMLLSDCDCESRSYLSLQIILYPHVPHLLCNVGENRYE